MLAKARPSLAWRHAPADPWEAKKLAMKLAKRMKKAMADLQNIVPEMSDYETWTETMQTCCITPYPPEIPGEKKEPDNVKMTKEKKKHEVCQSQRKLFD